jgi:hypothetical protein
VDDNEVADRCRIEVVLFVQLLVRVCLAVLVAIFWQKYMTTATAYLSMCVFGFVLCVSA